MTRVDLENIANVFIRKWKEVREPSLDVVGEYLPFCRELMFFEEGLVAEVLAILKENIEMWALEKSPVYMRSKSFYTKGDFEDRSAWYVGEVSDRSVDTQTSGSSTGFQFRYRRMADSFERIEWDNHYDMILDEFGIRPDPHVLYFFSHHFKKSEGEAFFMDPTPQPYLNSHGRSRSSIVHYANFDMYKSNPYCFFENFFEYVSNNRIDVLFSGGPQISSLCHHARKMGFEGMVASLLSQTNERLLIEDAEFMLDGGFCLDICDHMRCWDGGASFFTCGAGNVHLMDNFSWCEEVDGRLVSTDFFNFASPFVRYWNGDICSIGGKYSRCDCGRLYRDFYFLENRPFSLNGVDLSVLKSRMAGLNIKGIRQVRCYSDSLNVVSSRILSQDEIRKINSLEPKFKFVFSVED
jgi:hypothetical protein